MTTQVDDPACAIPGELRPWITDPGRYDLTDEQYHADPVVGGSLSSTGARLILAETPARFDHVRRNGGEDRPEFTFGRAAHSVVLGAGQPIAVLPYKDRRTKAYKAAVKAAEQAGEIPLLEDDAATVFAMATALDEHPIAGPLLRRPGRAEQSFVARDPESGVMCRARVDWMPDVEQGGRPILVDYKTTASAHPARFSRSAIDYGYHQQGDFYMSVLRWLYGEDYDPAFVLIAQEKTPPYLVAIYTLSSRALEWGRVLNRKARDVVRACTEADHWPGYNTGPVEIDIPAWVDHAYERAELAGEYDLTGGPE